jgi:hypothetical protein
MATNAAENSNPTNMILPWVRLSAAWNELDMVHPNAVLIWPAIEVAS